MKTRFPVADLALLLSLLVIAMPAAAQERSREHGSNARPAAPSAPSASSSSHSSPTPSSSSSARTPVPRSGGESSGAPANGGRDRERAGRGHSGGHSGGFHHHGYYPHNYWGIYYGYPYYWWWDGPDYGYPRPYYRGYGYGGYGDGGYGEGASGALDLDVAPDKTQVFLDGQYVGTVDDFDGWPQYLWLERGTYDLVLYFPGFKTVAKQISVYPGVVVDVNDRLEPGESVRPEDLATKTHERRDARVEQDRRQAWEAGPGQSRPGWRDRYRGDRGDDIRRQRPEPREEAIDEDEGDEPDTDLDDAPGESGELGEPAHVKISIEPSDASVYLDGHFVGTGGDLARRPSGLAVDAGEHRLSVVRPGRRSVERVFRAKDGEEVELEIDLQAE